MWRPSSWKSVSVLLQRGWVNTQQKRWRREPRAGSEGFAPEFRKLCLLKRLKELKHFSYNKDQLRTYGRTAISAGAFWWDDWDEFFRAFRGYGSVRVMQFINIEAEIKRKADDWHFLWSQWPCSRLMELHAFLKHKVGVECHIFTTHLSNAGHYPSPQEAWEAKLQDHIGKQSSLADEAKSYQHFEVPPGGIAHLGETLLKWLQLLSEQSCIKPIPVPVLEILCHPILSPPGPTNPEPQDDAKKAQEQLRQLTACVKEAAKAKRDQREQRLWMEVVLDRWIQFWESDTL